MVYSIRLAQQLAYIYDFDDLIEENGKIQTNGLLLFLGTMAGVNGLASLLRVSSSNAIKYASKQILGKPLMKTLWYPLLKKYFSIFPDEKEQKYIGQLLFLTDHLIAANQRKLEKLQELKKGYLQKMFC